MANVLGKRYQCEKCGTEVLCNKAGTGGLECCDLEMKIKEAKPLPSLRLGFTNAAARERGRRRT